MAAPLPLMIYGGSTESFYQKVDARYYWISVTARGL